MKAYCKNKLLYIDSSCRFLCLNSYISNDTLGIYYEHGNCFMTFYIHNDEYTLKVEYKTDIANKYKKNLKTTGYLKVKTKNKKLILNKKDFKINDTICGYFEVETEPYLILELYQYNSYIRQTDKFSGSFISKIKDLKEKKTYYLSVSPSRRGNL